MDKPLPRHIHLIGICGTAMASLAGMLQTRGHRVTGSDAAAYPPMSDFLASIGIAIAQPYAAGHLEPRPDLVIVGNAISRGNVELEYVLNQRIPMTSMAQLLQEEFLQEREVLCVAGTHGKTTTTSMLAWIFSVAGRDPSYLIGGIAENFGSSFAVSGGEHFIIEGDEYDTAFFDKGPKFLHYFPTTLILTSVEFDHADIYADLPAVETAFQRLVNLIPQRGRIVAFDSGASVERCLAKAFCPVERYGFTAAAHWQITDLHFASDSTQWHVRKQGEPWAEFSFPLAGRYNVLNATAAAAVADAHRIPVAKVAEALASFRSVKRRLEVKAEIAGVTIIDDFAHHPTAITETLTALRDRYRGRRLWAVLEPRSNTLRRKIFQAELAASLALADEVIVADVFKAEAIAVSERLSVADLIAGIEHLGKPARCLADADAIVAMIVPEVRAGDVIATLSNGAFGGIYEKLPTALRARFATLSAGGTI